MDCNPTYICIDLRSFYASVECVARGLDPLTRNLVVADASRGRTTICLAITPAMKALGVRNRCRLHQIPPGIDYLTATPRMHRYMEASAQIYGVYLRYISPDDIHVYSIDECFIDATPYLGLYATTPRQLAQRLMDAVFDETGISATAGIGTNLFLSKVALDVLAKHAPDSIGFLDQAEFERTVQQHRPITDIWNIGPGIAARLAGYGVFDLAGVARMDSATLYREFGVKAEYLMDHARGIEPCTIRQIHEYEPQGSSLSNGQVLPCDYGWTEAFTVMREMVDSSVLELVEKRLVCSSISLYVGYAFRTSKGRDAQGSDKTRDNTSEYLDGSMGASGNERTASAGCGLASDGFSDATGRGLAGSKSSASARCGPHAGGSSASAGRRRRGPHGGGARRLHGNTNSYNKLIKCFEALWRESVDADCGIRRICVGFSGLMPEEFASVDLFTDMTAEAEERSRQEAVLAVKRRFGKNALIKGMSLTEGATGRQRNAQIGGHRA